MSKVFQKIAFFSIFSLSLFGLPKEGELENTLTDLIETTERQLVLQKELKTLVKEFQSQRDLFCRADDGGSKTKEVATQMVQTAAVILKMAEEHHYLHLFSDADVEEFRRFAAIAKKNNPLIP